MNTILGNDVDSEKVLDSASTEADVIVTAAVLGFIGARWHLDQPCRFDMDHPAQNWKEEWVDSLPKDYQTFLHVMSAMSCILGKTSPGLSAFLKDGQSREWAPDALITGRAGAQMLAADKRHRKPQGNKFRTVANRLAANQPLKKAIEGVVDYSGAIYEGVGAYTGMIDDPVNDTLIIQPTKRIIDKNRWHPGTRHENWGLIERKNPNQPNLDTDPTVGMGLLPKGTVEWPNRIGYIHGMSSAIHGCVSGGAWCTPYEVAIGSNTTRMASCFACSTYMYAAGFPPSSIHLGRADSWVPPTERFETGEKEGMSKYDPAITRSLGARWHWEIYHYLCLGTKYLKQASEAKLKEQDDLKKAGIEDVKVIDYVNPTHANAVVRLEERLAGPKEGSNIGEEGGNLFLDALTVHDHDWRRIQRTLEPVYNHYDAGAKEILKRDERKEMEGKLKNGDILVGKK